ncbi:hypothetical protein DL766_005235 [Monosporascus sp. MC13-8B]|nr:hypothetical protein DL763_005609 [Monosporascus cannonballus]RYP29744.1 hypothetical protein DL766_005235 [Monosporascus sp. MC13-8B]
MSSFLAFPGLLINASKDLVHWNDVSNALSRVDQVPGLPGLPFLPKMTSGIYTPTLRFHEGTFYRTLTLSHSVYFSFPGFGPGAVWDNGGPTYICGAHMVAYFPEVMHVPMDLETGEIGEISRYRTLGSSGMLTSLRCQRKLVAAALAVLADGSYGNAPYFTNFPVGHERVFMSVTWEKDNFSRLHLRTWEHIGLTVIRWNDPGKVQGRSERPLGSSVPNLTGFDGDFALGCGQTVSGCRMGHSVFGFRVDVDWAESLKKERVEVGVSSLPRPAPALRPRRRNVPAISAAGRRACPGENGYLPRQNLRFCGIFQTPYRG